MSSRMKYTPCLKLSIGILWGCMDTWNMEMRRSLLLNMLVMVTFENTLMVSPVCSVIYQSTIMQSIYYSYFIIYYSGELKVVNYCCRDSGRRIRNWGASRHSNWCSSCNSLPSHVHRYVHRTKLERNKYVTTFLNSV